MTSLHLVSPLLFNTERWRLTICKYTNMDIFQMCTWLRYIHWRPPPPQERTGLWQKCRHPHRALSACSTGSKQQGGAEAPPKTEGSSPDSALPAAHSPLPQDKWVPLAPSEHSSTPSCYTEWSSQRTHWGRGGSQSDIKAHTASLYSSPVSRSSKNVYKHTSSTSHLVHCPVWHSELIQRPEPCRQFSIRQDWQIWPPSYAGRNYFKVFPHTVILFIWLSTAVQSVTDPSTNSTNGLQQVMAVLVLFCRLGRFTAKEWISSSPDSGLG